MSEGTVKKTAPSDVTFSFDGTITLRPFRQIAPPSGSVITASANAIFIEAPDPNAFLIHLQDNWGDSSRTA